MILNEELVCKVCGDPTVVTHKSHGRRYKRPYCRLHWNAYCADRARANYPYKKRLRGLVG